MEAQDLNFDLVRTIKVISLDENLNAMYLKKFPDESFDKVMEAAKAGILAKENQEYAESIFKGIILNKRALVEMYSRNLVSTKTKEVKETRVKKEKVKLPKEYNKIRIEADIKANDGVATEFMKAMLALNDMKNIRSRLNAKGKKQRYADGKAFTEAECREIIAVVGIIKNRLGKIK